MQVYSLYVINKAGGLVYQKNFGSDAPDLSMNLLLRLGSTFHSLHAITAQLSPVAGSSGIQVLETELYRVHCFQTATGIKFFLTAAKAALLLDQYLKTIYELYADYVLKNPFYEIEQPIRCELFDLQLERLLKNP
eukprot:TRINITY_DN9487_c0_g1_i1.p1 TRINITY_DN9487_c0_g1~~TRINITY_DN9487_c0_g1_i1.p1  ORF type:complete len:135 (+),score=18.19 TRINITY_DN9487_c0_g1_i1:190-594(+)